MEESTFAQTPVALTRLRACKTCKLIKTYDQVRRRRRPLRVLARCQSINRRPNRRPHRSLVQFYADFCENCPQKRPETVTAGNRADFVQTETTSDYEG